jgi:hypothetical protein
MVHLTCAPGAENAARTSHVSGSHTSHTLHMKIPPQVRAEMRQLLQDKINGKVTAVQDTDLIAMLHQELSPEGRLAASGWSELSE